MLHVLHTGFTHRNRLLGIVTRQGHLTVNTAGTEHLTTPPAMVLEVYRKCKYNGMSGVETYWKGEILFG